MDPACVRKGDVTKCEVNWSPYMEVNEARCGNWSDFAPSHVVLVANNLALSLPCLLFGLLFAISAMKPVFSDAAILENIKSI